MEGVKDVIVKIGKKGGWRELCVSCTQYGLQESRG